MALKFFSQADIDRMTPGTVSEEFKKYFSNLSDERKAGIIEVRPDLAGVLGYAVKKDESNDQEKLIDFNDIYDSDDTSYDSDENSEVTPNEETSNNQSEENSEYWNQIEKEIYLNEPIKATEVEGLSPLYALSVQGENMRCICHRIPLTRIQVKYKVNSFGTYGMYVFQCERCASLFVDEEKRESQDQKLTEMGVDHKFYDLSTSNSFLRSKMEADDISSLETIYVPDNWIEGRPICPIHNLQLDEINCVRRYKERSIELSLHICDKCGKYITRRSRVSDIMDLCAENGVPGFEFEDLRQVIPEKKPIPPKEVKPDFYIKNGKPVKYEYSYTAECFRLGESDTVVVSDTLYCDIEDHESEIVLALISVSTKRRGKQNYLLEAGYCSECQKYYVEEGDFKVVYEAGRPEVTVLYNVGDTEYHITSGEIFDLEKEHLGKLEGDIKTAISDIKAQPDFISKYAVGSYDDGALSFQKSQAQQRYGKSLETLESYISQPYSYRVDITFANETETYYLGPVDVELDDSKRVISFNDEFGRKLVNYRTVNLFKNGKQYSIKLSRQFDISQAQLYSYVNLRTDEDAIFRSGITDPFLIRVLNLRKQQHNLVDIIATIQENQNVIVDENIGNNIIVQGCAGSGKTMVLLHRLSALKYNHPDFDWDNALILTPNQHFNTHIGGLAEGLQIGSIERMTVEGYYLSLLLEYSEAFKPANKLASEMSLKQIFVDYIYSDDFINDFEASYSKIIDEYATRLNSLIDIYELLGNEKPQITIQNDSDYLNRINEHIKRLQAQIDRNRRLISDALASMEEAIDKKKALEKRIPEASEAFKKIVIEAVPRANSKLAAVISQKEKEIGEIEAEIREITAEKERLSSGIIVLNRTARIAGANKKLNNRQRDVEIAKQLIEEYKQYFIPADEVMTEEDAIAKMQPMILYDASISQEIALCNRMKQECINLQAEYDSMDAVIKAKQDEYLAVMESQYSESAITRFEEVKALLDGRNELSIYREVFENAIAGFVKMNDIKNYQGTHRYDLYAELLFAKHFYGKNVGTESFILVDEGQDISLNEYRMIFVQNSNAVVNIFGDVNQLIKPGRGIKSWVSLKKEMHAKEYSLNENYRNTNQITRFCNQTFKMKVLQTGVDGPKVKEINRKNLEEELNSLNIGSKRVAILVPRRVQKKKYLDEEALSAYVRSILGDSIENGKIALMYVDEVKGIEFDKVYVVPNRMSKNEKYIAFTRALSELTVVIDEKLEKPVSHTGNDKQVETYDIAEI